MRLLVLSDLHLEFGPIEVPAFEADVVVLAGDVHCKHNGLRWIWETFPKCPVLYVLGNHEFYGAKFPRLIEKLKAEAAGSHVRILENDEVEFDGWRFFGCTLWTDMALAGDPVIGMAEAQMMMNDFKRIRKSPEYGKLRPSHVRLRHLESVGELRRWLNLGDPKRSVVITHHAPSILSLPERRREELISCAYASRLDEIIEACGPALWIHGHIHHPQDYRIGTTRVLSNPRGYLDEGCVRGFNPGLVIEL